MFGSRNKPREAKIALAKVQQALQAYYLDFRRACGQALGLTNRSQHILARAVGEIPSWNIPVLLFW